MRIAFWGTGDTARWRIGQIRELSSQFEVAAFIDGFRDLEEGDGLWEGYRVVPPQKIEELELDCICILSVSEWEIRRRIYREHLFGLSKIISFHEICMMDSFGTDLDVCYKRMLANMPPMMEACAKRWRVYEYLKRQYSHILFDSRYWEISTEKKVELEKNIRPVWTLWLQGMEQAPEVIKMCVRSLERAMGEGEKLYVLDQDSLFQYIDLPDFIIEKWRAGVISNTKFSNLVRLRLLNVYGGIWIDATVYVTDSRLPDYIRQDRLFMYQIWQKWGIRNDPMISANWLISAPPENKLLMILEALMREYWRREERELDYAFFHIFWTMVAECFPAEWAQVENVQRNPAMLLLWELMCPFDRERFDDLRQTSGIHKLSYKVPYEEADEGSFWAKIREMEKEQMEGIKA